MTVEFAIGVINVLNEKIALTRKAAASLSETTDPGIYIRLDGLEDPGVLRWRQTNIETFDPANPEIAGVPWLAQFVDTLRPLNLGHFPVVIHAGDEGVAITLYDLVPGTDINAAVECN